MTTLVKADLLDMETGWDNITEWLDHTASTTHHTHRQVLELEDQLEALQEELYDWDRSINWNELSASEQVALFRLNLRLRDLHTMLARKWSSPLVRSSALRAVRGIHETFLGTIADERNEQVIFTVSRATWTHDLVGYIEAFRLERSGHWCTPAGSTHGITMTAAEGPRWVHDLYRHMLDGGNEGERLRAHYRCDSATNLSRHGHALGRAVLRPTDEQLEAALTLWTPDNAGPFQDLADATDAARLL